jgi:uncharacterized membrane protein
MSDRPQSKEQTDRLRHLAREIRYYGDAAKQRERAEKAKAEVERLRELIEHVWMQSGSPDCGYAQMDTEMKRLYDSIVRPNSTPTKETQHD